MGRRSLLWGMLLLACACGPTKPVKNPRFDLKKPRAALPPPKLSGPPALPSVVIAELASAESEVHFARNGGRGLLVTRSKGRWLAGPVKVTASLEGAVRDDAALRDVGAAPAETMPTSLRPVADGFALSWIQTGGEVWVLALDTSGKAAGKPAKVAQSFEALSWVDVLATDKGAVLVWEATHGPKHELWASSWTKKGPGKAIAITREAIGWQAAAGPRGALVVWVDGEPGRVHALEVGADGSASSPTVLLDKAAALADPQVAALADRYVVGWTGAGGADHRVELAQVGPGAKVLAAPAGVLPPVGGQALVSLVAAADRQRVLLAWERDLGFAMPSRRIELATLGADGALGASRATLEFHAAEEAPHLTADGAGFAALTLAPMAMRDGSLDRADGGDPLAGPVFVRFDKDLALLAAEPIRIADLKEQGVGIEGVPESVRDLWCADGLCTVVATGNGKPALLALATLPVRSSPWRQPAEHLGPAGKPAASALATLTESDAPLADLAAARLADGRTLVVWVTHVVDAGDPATPQATLAYRFVDDQGAASPITTLSQRAISVGGVSVAPLPAGEGPRAPVAVLGWAGPDGKSPQVFATLVGAGGEKLEQKTITQLSRSKRGVVSSEVYDVDVVAEADGRFLFAWSDSRDGNPEIYVARANARLDKSRVDLRVTTGDGASVEPRLQIVGDRVLLTFSDAPVGGGDKADVFVAQLEGKDLSVRSKPRPVDESPAHSRTPRWVGTAAAPALGWIDEAEGETPAALRLIALDAQGGGTTAARRVRLRGEVPVTSAVVSCSADECRGVIAGAEGALMSLGAFTSARESGAPVFAGGLLTLGGGSAQDVALADGGGLATVYFVADAGNGARVRQLGVDW